MKQMGRNPNQNQNEGIRVAKILTSACWTVGGNVQETVERGVGELKKTKLNKE